ncbi:TonB family protein [Nannocystis pusilla]|uniref:TonB C-terminal domain-containing protein n=1 Tax=Nannocystis pusilla TaxID=889268 RepID=A0ABS7TZH4_9BACT|nr:TonB C-terminal domain-containing protein [Nannocystis pusilla]
MTTSLLVLIRSDDRVASHPVARKPACVNGYERGLGLLEKALSGAEDQLYDGLLHTIVDGKCETEVIVALVDDKEPIEPLAELEDPEPPEPRKKEREKKKKEQEKPPEPLPVEEPKPEEKKKEEEKPPEEEQPKEKIDFELLQLKMVEQLEEKDEKESPDDAHYLSNVNRDVTEETRAEITNLQRDAEQAKASQQEPSDDPTKGMAAEDKIAETREQKSQLAQEAPKVQQSPETKIPEQNDPKAKSKLSMRDLAPREHSPEMLKHEAAADAAAAGELAPDQKAQAAVMQRNKQQAGSSDTKSPVLRFRLSANEMNALFGRDIAEKKDVISQRQSKKKGIWEEARELYQSPLENMVPEVRPGNQTALRSRKHPFAQFIATMHRTIHDKWAFGFLEQLDTMGRGNALNKPDLWTRVEIVLNSDGSLDKLRTVRYSGNMQFDGAAREVVRNSGPYPQPPREILSGNGKVYIHWAFHRDERACGTFGAEPFILDNAGQGERPDPNRAVRPASSESEAMASRRLARQMGPAAPGPSGPEGPAAPGGHNHEHGEGDGHNHERGTPPPEQGGDQADPEAGHAATAWLKVFAARDAAKLAARASLPFVIGDQVVARTREELQGVLQAMLDEAGSGTPGPAEVFTAAGLRKRFGSVPAGVQEGLGRNYAVSKVRGEPFILILERRFGDWRVVGVAR